MTPTRNGMHHARPLESSALRWTCNPQEFEFHTTADVADLAPGLGKITVLTTNKGRIVERLFVNHLGARLLLIGGSGDDGHR